MVDRAVIKNGASAPIYKAVLVNQEFKGPVFSFSSAFKISNHLNRLKMIEKKKSPVLKGLSVLALVPVFICYFWFTAEAQVKTEPKKQTITIIKSSAFGKDSSNVTLKVINVNSNDPINLETLTKSIDSNNIQLNVEYKDTLPVVKARIINRDTKFYTKK